MELKVSMGSKVWDMFPNKIKEMTAFKGQIKNGNQKIVSDAIVT